MNDPQGSIDSSSGAGPAAAAPAASTSAFDGSVQPGDRLIAGIWIAMGLVVLRALLQSAVDALKEGESGTLLLEHFVDHLVQATSRAWLIVPPLAVLPRGRSRTTILLRGVVAAVLSVILLAGWPDGAPRYTPGTDTRRSLLGWFAIALGAATVVALDRYATSPRRRVFHWSPPVRFTVTSLVLIGGGGAIATTVQVLDWRRESMEVEGVVVDLLEQFPQAQASSGSPVAVKVGSLLADRGDESAGGNKPSLVMGIPAAIEWELDVPPNTSLSFSCAFDRMSLRPKSTPSQRIRFSASVDGQEIFFKEIRPQQVEAHRGWIDRTCELDEWAGKRVKLRFATSGSGPEIEQARVGFGRPLLVRTESRPRVAASAGKPNLVLVVVDSLRRDRVHAFGYSRETTPELDRIAAESLVFTRAESPSSWTWPAVASLFTGLYPPTHGVVDVDRCFLSDSLLTLAEVLQASGVTTLGCSTNPLITHAKNFQQGFEVWREFPLYTASRAAEEFSDWVSRYRDYEFFAYVHLMDPNRPFNPPEDWALRFARPSAVAEMRTAVTKVRGEGGGDGAPKVEEQGVTPKLAEQDLSDLYDAEVASVDAEIGHMRQRLVEAKLWNNTIFVVVSDHGERLDLIAPPAGSSLDPQLLDVPLLIHDPRRAPARIDDVVDTTFLAATLIAAIDARPLPGGPPPLPLPPWGKARAPFAFSHTARGLLAGSTTPTELVALANSECRLVLTADGNGVEWNDLRSGAVPADSERRKSALARRLKSWLESCRKDAVARPFDRMDYATRDALERFDILDPAR